MKKVKLSLITAVLIDGYNVRDKPFLERWLDHVSITMNKPKIFNKNSKGKYDYKKFIKRK